MTAAHAVEVGDDLLAASALLRPDYASAVEVTFSDAEARSPERWARATFEGAPGPVRWVLRAGWRFGLGFRLGPRSSPDHVLGARITDTGPEVVVLELRSRLLLAHNVFLVRDGRVRVATLVRYESGAARPLWSVVSTVHRAVVPHLLNRAASTRP